MPDPINQPEVLPPMIPDENPQSPIAPKKGGSVIVDTLNLVAEPARRLIVHPLRRRYHRHYHPRHRYGRFHLIADSLLATTVIALLIAVGVGYWQNHHIEISKLDLTLEATGQAVVTGEPTTLRLGLTNREDSTLENAKITLKFPTTFEILRVEPSDGWSALTRQLVIGNVNKNDSTRVTITGVLWAAPKQLVNISATAVGSTANQSIQTSTTLSLVSDAVALNVKPTIASTMVLKQPNTVSWSISNTSSLAFHNLKAVVDIPANWKKAGTTPTIIGSTWNIDILNPGTSTTMAMIGQFDILPSAPSFTVHLRSQASGDDVDLTSSRADTTILDPSFEITTQIQKPTGALTPGEHVVVTLNYHNRGEFSLEDVVITANVKGLYVQPSSLLASNGKIVNQKAQWDKTIMSNLESIVPDQSGTVTLEFDTALTANLSTVSPLDNLSILIDPTSTFRVGVLPNTTVQWQGQTGALPINSVVGLAAQARYFTVDGEQVGRGPLPPRVGKETKYWISLNLTNTVHDVYETKVVVILPAGVTYTGQTSVNTGDPLRYTPSTRTIQWTIGRLDHFLGPTPPNVNANIEVSVKPTADQIGTSIPLMTSASVQGIDVVTKKQLSVSTGQLTTNLVSDPLARGKGNVLP